MVKLNLDFRIKVTTEYLSGIGSTSLAKKYRISEEGTILLWASRFQKYGMDGLKLKHRKNVSTIHAKEPLVELRLIG
ncbi:helix-turn-helix domain-containing protein [Levilactobacillus sp. HBUAS70063]|uniref:helix-turn-helix domain-containing protein n=1 Tax=Levilactobacillus sp. HBUAS70063 TaxID=3109359 RepID=UPI003132A0E1